MEGVGRDKNQEKTNGEKIQQMDRHGGG